MLVGTTSVENSELISARLRAEPLRRLSQVLILRDAWMIRNKYQEDGRQIPELQYLNEPIDNLDLNQMRKMARELEIPFNPEEETNLKSPGKNPWSAPKLGGSFTGRSSGWYPTPGFERSQTHRRESDHC